MHSSIQWLITCAAFADTGGMANGDELSKRLRDAVPGSQPVPLVQRWIESRAVVVVHRPNGWMLPLFQFDLATASLKPAMRPVLAVLQGVFNETELALWFVAPNDWLGGGRPALVMQKNLPAVLNAARSDRYIALGA